MITCNSPFLHTPQPDWQAREFTEDSLALHQIGTADCDGPPAMKENIVIPINIERLKVWLRRTLEAAAWLMCLGLLATSAAVAACGALAWLVAGSETVLAAALGGAVLLARISHKRGSTAGC